MDSKFYFPDHFTILIYSYNARVAIYIVKIKLYCIYTYTFEFEFPKVRERYQEKWELFPWFVGESIIRANGQKLPKYGNTKTLGPTNYP